MGALELWRFVVGQSEDQRYAMSFNCGRCEILVKRMGLCECFKDTSQELREHLYYACSYLLSIPVDYSFACASRIHLDIDERTFVRHETSSCDSTIISSSSGKWQPSDLGLEKSSCGSRT